eukprot:CAMPEP_0184412408 /NCGR_PEP_ID=MMETSP0738-20130409/6417_1 /TAXON_ID=385413 /ORGANISM="Thalassiosira miniscula, Strain CCMP1093" /LENGTH=807 /DNA_ID=CAMNT_0026770893 /DNA_START=45 /DNA_END=2468 /DNA_ORIENTATION=+
MVLGTSAIDGNSLANITNKSSAYDAPTSIYTAKDEAREPGYSDSSDDDDSCDSYADFLAFLKDPSPPKPAPKTVKVIEEEPKEEKRGESRDQEGYLAFVKSPSNRVQQAQAATAFNKPFLEANGEAPVAANTSKIEYVERKVTATTEASSDYGSSLSSESSESSWSSGSEAVEKTVPAPVMLEAKSIGRGQMSSNDINVESIEETSKPVPAMKSDPKPVSKPVPEFKKEAAQVASAPPSRAAASKSVSVRERKIEQSARFELPKSASVATIHFDQEEVKKAQDMEALREQVKNKEPVEPLPIDYYTKLGEAEMEAKAKAAWELAEKDMPIGIKYFTLKGEEDRLAHEAEVYRLSQENMSDATRHFHKIEDEKEAASLASAKQDLMPAAIQHFTMADRAIKDKQRAEIEDMKVNPPEMPPGQEYFTKQMLAEQERKRAEIQDMIDNPPPPTVAGQHFNKVEEQRKKEMEALLNEPAPPAVEYFTQQWLEEKKEQELALKKANETPHEPPVATQYFDELEVKKAAEMEALRAQAKNKTPEEPVPVDYFTKLGLAEMEANAKAAWELAESQMPIGIAYFTAKGEEERLAREEEQRRLSEQEMPLATKHFHKITADKEAASQAGEPELMPAAIQHFTMADRAEKEKKRAEIEEMKANPPEMPPGQEYFTKQMLAEQGRKRAEIQEMIENPPPPTIAGQHFNKVEEQRKKEMEALLNEPAPPAIEYFTQQWLEEKEQQELAAKAANEIPYEAPIATKYFERVDEMRKTEIEEARERTRQKKMDPDARISIDWKDYTKQEAPTVSSFYKISAE